MRIRIVCACLVAVCSRSLVAQNQSKGTTLGASIKSAIERNNHDEAAPHEEAIVRLESVVGKERLLHGGVSVRLHAEEKTWGRQDLLNGLIQTNPEIQAARWR